MIRLDRLHIRNFKSLYEFELNFLDFTCLIGLNSSGKSTILQAIDFFAQQMNGNFSGWLRERGWEANELRCKLVKSKNIQGVISFHDNHNGYAWAFNFNTTLKKCTSEYLTMVKNVSNLEIETIFKVRDDKYTITIDLETKEKRHGDIVQEYEGSFLASLKSDFLPQPIKEFKTYLENIYSLDLLAPQELRKRSRKGSKLGLSGENLSAFLDTFSTEQKRTLLEQLQKCYPHLESLDIRKSAGGWSQLELVEKFGTIKLVNEAKYLNDGVLRLIAILSQLQNNPSFLLFDEIENGINAELVEFLIDTLIASGHQIMITTHSPMILNYIDDETAIKSVQYIYKTPEGFTQSIPFFDIPSMKEKLEFMGAGEVYVDTNLVKLYEEIKSLTAKNNAKMDS